MKGEILLDTEMSWQGRIVLFCIDGRCMSGRISSFKKVEENRKFGISVEFIEPAYFEHQIVIGNTFSILEASRTIAMGTITGR